ncbi:MAG: hypothetical protein EKK63_03025 [Acinetobacter sp.]|uniref:hypothetical protein n=1 Tax=Acinetobacter sp. TaxID=472 RepID=UPI000F96D722|nr:hypothetical protein [Acinetobacter sp.]RUP42028.1 MAG: hypothetical protein EKK63_03025 [Acinetobacter sp.]
MGSVNFTPTSNILNSFANNTNNVSKKTNECNAALDNITNPEKYASRAELDKTGLGDIHDAAQAVGINTLANKTTLNITAEKLRMEYETWGDINKIVVDFHKNYVQNARGAGTNAEKADHALKEIQKVLRRQTADGDYVFGGNNPTNDPLSVFDGEKRVSKNLSEISNNLDGVFVNNFSEANKNETIVTISSKHDVRQSFLYAGMDPIIKTIGYLNMVKEGTASLDDMTVAQKSQQDARGEIEILIDLEIKKTEAARTVNKNDLKNSYDTLKIFKADITETAGRAGDLMKSLLATISIQSTRNKLFDALIQGFNK